MRIFQDIENQCIRFGESQGTLTGAAVPQVPLGWTRTKIGDIPAELRMHSNWCRPEALRLIPLSSTPLEEHWGLKEERVRRFGMEDRLEQWAGIPLSPKEKRLLISLSLRTTRAEMWCTSFRERVRSLAGKGLVFLSQRSYGTTLEDCRVYFIQAGGPGGRIKIGSSNDTRRRFQAFQKDNPLDLSLLGTLPGNRITEGDLHKRLKPWRANASSRREWYEPSDAVLLFQKDPSFFTKRTHPSFS